jgi:NAD(P)H-flavin reductase
MPAPEGPLVPVPHRVRSRVQETTDTWTLELEPAGGNGPEADFGPGQFNMLFAFGVGEVPISISGVTGNGALVHTIRDVGAVTKALCAAEVGTVVGLRGPYGSSWPLAAAEGRDLVIVAGGLGLAPLRSAVVEALESPGRVRSTHLLYGGREPGQLLYREEVGRWLTSGVEAALTVDSADSGWIGEVGVVTKLVVRAPFDPADAVALVCGPEVMMRFVARALAVRGVEPERIYLSLERNMKCAVTHCGRCQLGPSFVCREGPVFRLADVEPWLAIREL